MLVRFYNLGKIKETELDLRPMTVIIGPNNANKTYLAYSLYGLWQAVPARFSLNMPILRNFSRGYDNKSVLVKIDETFVTALQSNYNREITDFEEELTSFYQDSSGRLFSQTHFQIEVTHREVMDALQHIPNTAVGTFRPEQYEVSLTEELLTFHLRESQALEGSSAEAGTPIRDADFMDVAVNLEAFLREELFSRPFLLPAERNAFVITYKLLAK